MIKIKYKNLIRRNIAGTIIPLFALLLPLFIAFMGLASDLTYYGTLRSTLERATDASVRAGRQSYKHLGKDPGLAVNDAIRVFRMNILNTIGGGNYYASTGYKTPTILTYTQTFTQSDGLSTVFRGSSIDFTATIDLGATARTITVTSMLTPKPFFLNIANPITISRLQYLIGSPKDIVLVVDISREDRLKTIKTYVGRADRNVAMGMASTFDDVILFQTQSRANIPPSITPPDANGYNLTNILIRDVINNTPGYDIPTAATYSDGTSIYRNDPPRGFVTNNYPDHSTLYRNTLTGNRISELSMLMGISAEDLTLAQSYSDNQAAGAQLATYFNRAAAHIEPIASLSYGAMVFADEIQGSLRHRFALVTYASNSQIFDWTDNWQATELEYSNMGGRSVVRTLPFSNFSTDFSAVANRLVVQTTGGQGSNMSDPFLINNYPNGTTDIRDALNNANSLFNSGSSAFERIVILYASNDPQTGYAPVGTAVASLVANGVTVYSIVSTISLTPSDVTNFQTAIEGNGGEPVIFVTDPVDIDNAFLQVADDLT